VPAVTRQVQARKQGDKFSQTTYVVLTNFHKLWLHLIIKLPQLPADIEPHQHRQNKRNKFEPRMISKPMDNSLA